MFTPSHDVCSILAKQNLIATAALDFVHQGVGLLEKSVEVLRRYAIAGNTDTECHRPSVTCIASSRRQRSFSK